MRKIVLTLTLIIAGVAIAPIFAALWIAQLAMDILWTVAAMTSAAAIAVICFAERKLAKK